jgi:hypothetical protein
MMNDDQQQAVGGTGPMSSVTRDVQAVRANSASTAKELRAFLVQLKGRSPREMLGMVAQSSLIKSVATATLLMAVVILVATIVPYGIGKYKQVVGNAKEKLRTEMAGMPTDDEASGSELEPDTPGSPASPSATDKVNGAATVKKPASTSLEDTLGIGDALEAPADVNPLESKADDLFKDLE